MDVRILIVDDHPTVREALRFVFTAAGMRHIVEAVTCAEAIEIVRDRDIDFVLLDVTLCDGNGMDVLREIKAIEPAIPVLIHSYYDTPRLLSRSFDLSAAGYVVKGHDKNDLIRAVRQAALGESVWTAEQMAQIREAKDGFGSSRTRQKLVCG